MSAVELWSRVPQPFLIFSALVFLFYAGPISRFQGSIQGWDEATRRKEEIAFQFGGAIVAGLWVGAMVGASVARWGMR